MRIALVSQEYPPETAHGGIATQTHSKAHALAALGHELHVISRSHDGVARSYRQGSVSVTRLPLLDGGFAAHTDPADWLTYSAQVAAAVQRLDRAAPLDVVEVPEYGGEGYVHLLNQSDGNHIPTVVHLHGPVVMLAHQLGWPEIDSPLYRVGTEMEGTSVRLADAVYSSSGCSADSCSKAYGVDRDAIEVIHAGVDTTHFRPGRAPTNADPTLLFVGRIARSKGVETLVDAALQLVTEFPSLRVKLIGRDVDRLGERLTERATDAGHRGLVEAVGALGRDDLPAEMCRAHVFAAPSVYEGGPGFVYLEAMACGTPVVGCRGSGIDEVVRHGENGMLVTPNDTDDLVAVLRELLYDEALRARLSNAARRFAVDHADTERCVPRIARLYQSVARGGAS